jgi:hypothetical protein
MIFRGNSVAQAGNSYGGSSIFAAPFKEGLVPAEEVRDGSSIHASEDVARAEAP